MYEYRVIALLVRECEERFNELAKDGWRLVSTSPNLARGYGVVATFEREVKPESL